MSDQVLPTEFKFAHRLHIVVKSDFMLLWPGQMTRRPRVVLFVVECSFLLRQVVAVAAGMFNPSFTRHGLPSWQQTLPFSHVRMGYGVPLLKKLWADFHLLQCGQREVKRTCPTRIGVLFSQLFRTRHLKQLAAFCLYTIGPQLSRLKRLHDEKNAGCRLSSC